MITGRALNNRAAVIDDAAASYRELQSRTESLASKARQPAVTAKRQNGSLKGEHQRD